MSLITVYKNGTANIDVPFNSKISINAMGAKAEIYYSNHPSEPEVWIYQQTLNNDIVELGTFSTVKRVRIVAIGGDVLYDVAAAPSTLMPIFQGAPTAKTTSSTLTAAQMLTGIITVNQGAAGSSAQQLPLATAMDSALSHFTVDDSFDFSVINISTVAAEDATITTNTGWTLVGDINIASNAAATDKSAGRFRARKTGTGAWTLYRLS